MFVHDATRRRNQELKEDGSKKKGTDTGHTSLGLDRSNSGNDDSNSNSSSSSSSSSSDDSDGGDSDYRPEVGSEERSESECQESNCEQWLASLKSPRNWGEDHRVGCSEVDARSAEQWRATGDILH